MSELGPSRVAPSSRGSGRSEIGRTTTSSLAGVYSGTNTLPVLIEHNLRQC